MKDYKWCLLTFLAILLALTSVTISSCPVAKGEVILQAWNRPVLFHGMEFGMSQDNIRSIYSEIGLTGHEEIISSNGLTYNISTYEFEEPVTNKTNIHSLIEDMIQVYNQPYASYGHSIHYGMYTNITCNDKLVMSIFDGNITGLQNYGLMYGKTERQKQTDDNFNYEWFKNFVQTISYLYRCPMSNYFIEGNNLYPYNSTLSDLCIIHGSITGKYDYDPLIGGSGGPLTKAWAYWNAIPTKGADDGRIDFTHANHDCVLYAITDEMNITLYMIDSGFYRAFFQQDATSAIKYYIENWN